LLCVKTKSGAHKQLTFYFQMRKYFCRHLHSSLISMAETGLRALAFTSRKLIKTSLRFARRARGYTCLASLANATTFEKDSDL
jgi:hypothetical protein